MRACQVLQGLIFLRYRLETAANDWYHIISLISTLFISFIRNQWQHVQLNIFGGWSGIISECDYSISFFGSNSLFISNFVVYSLFLSAVTKRVNFGLLQWGGSRGGEMGEFSSPLPQAPSFLFFLSLKYLNNIWFLWCLFFCYIKKIPPLFQNPESAHEWSLNYSLVNFTYTSIFHQQ